MGVTREVAELSDLAARATSRDELRREALARLDRYVGFDFGIVWCPGDPVATLVGFDDAIWRRYAAREAAYAPDVAPLVAAAMQRGGVCRDVDVLDARRRESSPFYDEIIRPSGSAGFLTAVLRLRGRTVGMMQLGRASRPAASFRERHVEQLGRLLGVLALGEAAHALPGRPPDAHLTPREAEIVRYVTLGLTNREIARACRTSPNTVRNQLASVFRKADVSTRAELVAWALGALA